MRRWMGGQWSGWRTGVTWQVSGGSDAGCSVPNKLGVTKWWPKVEKYRSNAAVTGVITSRNIIAHIHFGVHFRPSTQSFKSQRRKNLVSIEFSYNCFHFSFKHSSSTVVPPPKKKYYRSLNCQNRPNCCPFLLEIKQKTNPEAEKAHGCSTRSGPHILCHVKSSAFPFPPGEFILWHSHNRQ